MSIDLTPEKTADGSYTLISKRFGSSYHSVHGALQESVHVFLKQGFQFYIENHPSPSVKILEMGLGTALNLWLTVQEVKEKNISLRYTAIEAFPPEESLYPIISRDELHLRLLLAPWENIYQELGGLELYKRQELLADFLEQTDETYDIIYYDAFGPGSQPELWEAGIFEKLYHLTTPGGVFVTYCAQGNMRRALKTAGYQVERLPGPPYKRHMTRAVKPAV